MFVGVWLLSIVATLVVADQKNRSILGFFFLALVLGPIALVVVLLASPNPRAEGAPYIPASSGNLAQELASIKTTLAALQQRVGQLERQTGLIADVAPPEPAPAPVETFRPAQDAVANVAGKPEALEFVLGQYWLSRIGVVLFVVGIGLFISYTFRYFPPFVKIGIGYALAAAFLVWGERLEKNAALRRVSWAILGGAWGLFYLTTYAMHYIPATAVIANATVELVLLWIVSVFCVQYNLKYKSWIATAISFLLGFMTMTLGSIDFPSVMFWALLLGSLGYLVVAVNWFELLIAGMIGGYGLFALVFAPKLGLLNFFHGAPVLHFRIGFALLTVTWAVFMLTAMVIRLKDRAPVRQVMMCLVSNTSMYALLGLALISRLNVHHSTSRRFYFLIILALTHLALAGFSRLARQSKDIVAHAALAVVLASTAVFIHYPQLAVSFWWIIEMIFLVGLGMLYRERLYCLLGWVVGIGVLWRFVVVDLYSRALYQFGEGGIDHSWLVTFTALTAYLAPAVAMDRPSIKHRVGVEERELYVYTYSLAATLVGVLFLSHVSPAAWLTLHWTVWGLLLLLAGFGLKHKPLRLAALGVLALACGRIVTFDLSGVDTIYKTVVVIFLGAVLLGISLIYSRFKQNSSTEGSS